MKTHNYIINHEIIFEIGSMYLMILFCLLKKFYFNYLRSLQIINYIQFCFSLVELKSSTGSVITSTGTVLVYTVIAKCPSILYKSPSVIITTVPHFWFSFVLFWDFTWHYLGAALGSVSSGGAWGTMQCQGSNPGLPHKKVCAQPVGLSLWPLNTAIF